MSAFHPFQTFRRRSEFDPLQTQTNRRMMSLGRIGEVRMGIERRAFIAAGLGIAGTLLGSGAEACSISPSVKPRPFSDAACRRQIRELVTLLNEAPSMDSNAIEAWLAQHRINFGDDLLWAGSEQLDPATFVRTFKLSDGKEDIKPIRLADMSLIRERGNRASYAFTLRRYSYHAADPEGCNGLFVHDEYWGEEEAAYIAAFENNRMGSLRGFPEWFAGD